MTQTSTFSRRLALSFFAGAAALVLDPETALAQRKIYAKRLKGKRAPKIRIGTWIQRKTSLSGKPILIKFFATWCPVCRTSVKPLNRLQKELKSRVTIVAISDQSESQVKQFFKSRNANYAVGLDKSNRTFKAYGIKGAFPHFVLINSKGRVVDEGPLPVHDYSRLKRRIRKYV